MDRWKQPGRNLPLFDNTSFGRKDAQLPSCQTTVSPLFPTLHCKPIPLIDDDITRYLLVLSQGYEVSLKRSGCYMDVEKTNKPMRRYSDKYQSNTASTSCQFDWNRLPAELQTKRKKTAESREAKKQRIKLSEKGLDEKLQSLEKREEQSENETDITSDKEEKDEEDNEQDLSDSEYEGEMEEETDYNLTYFDNGENYDKDDDDDLDEGPTY